MYTMNDLTDGFHFMQFHQLFIPDGVQVEPRTLTMRLVFCKTLVFDAMHDCGARLMMLKEMCGFYL